MPRNKKKGKAAEFQLNEAARAAHREQEKRHTSQLVMLGPSPEPALLPPSQSFNELKDVLKQDRLRHAWVQAGLVSLPADNDDDFPPEKSPFKPTEQIKERVKALDQLWAKEGYYIHHPNNNRSARTAARLKQMIERDNKLGEVVENYKLYLNSSKKRTMLLQYPNRDAGQEYREAYGSKPLEIRIKPKCGVVEVDIPMNIHAFFDKEKGIQYGEAMRNSQLLQEGGSYGLAGGMGIERKKQPKKGQRSSSHIGPSPEKLLENFDDANNKGHIMNKITLGGRIVPFKDGDPMYMIATFSEDICTWTKLDCRVQLRPQFGHVDALNEMGKSVRSEANGEEKDEEYPPEEENKAKAVNMAVKSADKDEDSDMYGGMSETAKLLRAIRDEPFQRLKWIDQDDDESYQVYDDTLIYQDPESAPQLVSEMTDEQYLDAISCPRVDPTKRGKKVMAEYQNTDDESESDLFYDTEDMDAEEELEEPPGPPKGVVHPVGHGELRVEVCCRKICCSPPNKEAYWENLLKHKFLNNSDYGFLFKGHREHPYYKWRLAENRAGRGHTPKHDADYLVK